MASKMQKSNFGVGIFILLASVGVCQVKVSHKESTDYTETRTHKVERFRTPPPVPGDVEPIIVTKSGFERHLKANSARYRIALQADADGNTLKKVPLWQSLPTCAEYERGVCAKPSNPFQNTCEEDWCWFRPKKAYVGKKAYEIPQEGRYRYPTKIKIKACTKPHHPCARSSMSRRCQSHCQPRLWYRVEAMMWVVMEAKNSNVKLYTELNAYYWMPYGCHCYPPPPIPTTVRPGWILAWPRPTTPSWAFLPTRTLKPIVFPSTTEAGGGGSTTKRD